MQDNEEGVEIKGHEGKFVEVNLNDDSQEDLNESQNEQPKLSFGARIYNKIFGKTYVARTQDYDHKSQHEEWVKNNPITNSVNSAVRVASRSAVEFAKVTGAISAAKMADRMAKKFMSAGQKASSSAYSAGSYAYNKVAGKGDGREV